LHGFGVQAVKKPGLGVVSDSLPLLLASGGSAALSMVYAAISARQLNPAGFADVAASLSLSLFLLLPTGPIESGITAAAAEAYGAGNRGLLRGVQKDALRVVATWLGGGLLVWLPLLPLVRDWLHVRELSTLLALSTYVAAAFVCCVPRAILRGDHRFSGYASNQVFESFMRVLAGAALMSLGVGASGAVAGYAIGMAAAVVLARFQLRTLPAAAQEKSEFHARPTSLPLFVMSFYSLSLMNLDVLVAKRNLLPAESGLYAAASTLSRTLFLFATPIYQVLFSKVASERAAGRNTALLVRRALSALAALLALSCVVPFGFGELPLRLLFGVAFVDAVVPLQLLWLSCAVLALEIALAFVLVAQGHGRLLLWLLLPCAVFFVLLALYATSARSLAQVTLFSSVLGGTLMLILGRRAWSTRARSES
jgi:O-antigen/teichoic acid export membrane protein